MDEDKAVLMIILALIALLALTAIFRASSDIQALIADITKVAVSGYIGYISGKGR